MIVCPRWNSCGRAIKEMTSRWSGRVAASLYLNGTSAGPAGEPWHDTTLLHNSTHSTDSTHGTRHTHPRTHTTRASRVAFVSQGGLHHLHQHAAGGLVDVVRRVHGRVRRGDHRHQRPAGQHQTQTHTNGQAMKTFARVSILFGGNFLFGVKVCELQTRACWTEEV